MVGYNATGPLLHPAVQKRGGSLVTGALVRLLFISCYCFIISCLWDLGQIHSIVRITHFSEFQQTSNIHKLHLACSCEEEEEIELCVLIWYIQPSVQRGLARRPISPVVPVYNTDAYPIPQCLVVPTMPAGKTIKDLLFVPLFVAQVKGRRQNLLNSCCKV